MFYLAPGQFIIVKIDEKGERIPLTICDYDRNKGTVTIVFQTLGSGYNIGYKTYTSLLIIHYFSPLQATFFTFLLNWLSSSLIGIIISSCNMILKGKINGIIISSFLVFFDLFVVYFPRLSWFSPVTWSNLECIKISNNSDLPSITFIIFMYILSILFIFIFNLFYHQKNKFEID